ncbi:hypothetical protein FPZ42_05515 [Mucilaginibacter achroorhodeus]|uniref:TPM domain-containing protein n=1 Tax=Mucilaginibacter achroorhodeus TaxID=2599294 RepID=A0A563UBJ7_9SPHI|nr:TPM domain-containing protein [Mucilaginibacter achroorhodeus]TWR28663.1 hypothetical protein FPZ42_05515 [Mucilaginibacter achroorhodeus]
MKYLFSLLLSFCTLAALSQIPTPQKDTYVNDFAKVLSKDDLKKINKSINQIEKRTGVQFAVVLVDKIPKQYDIEEYALLIARRWKVGNHEDGLVYVAAIKQRKQRLEVARNLEPIFTEETSLAALNRVKPFFKAKDYAGGVSELTEAIMDDLSTAQYSSLPKIDSAVHSSKAVAAESAVKDKKDDDSFLYAVITLLVVIILYGFFKRRRAGGSLGNYGGGYGGGGYGGGGSGLGSFVAGAATGYMANEMMDKNRGRQEEENRRRQQEQEAAERYAEEQRRLRAETERRSDTYGNWGSSRSSSGGSSSGGGSSSSSSGGFSGGGATSDW